MKLRCAFCGKPMQSAAILVGDYPVGPKCARRAGLMPLALKKSGAIRPGPAYRKSATRQELAQMDLFEVAA